MSRLGVVAGGGALPLTVARRCEAEGRSFFVVRIKGFADEALARYEGAESRIGEFGRTIKLLKAAGCEAVCFAGMVQRPDFRDMKPDLKGAAVLPGMIAAAAKGDDALLRYVLGVFEAEGFAIEGADQVLGGETLPAGPLGRHAPDEAALADVRKALEVARAAGELDIGQGAVVCDGLVLAVEAQEGTDAMLARVAGLPETLRGRSDARRGALAKAPKPIQDERVDMPVIGVRTLEGAAAAGLAGVAGMAGKLILIDREAIIETADRLGLFVWGEDHR
jgi:UDP-2,3-diacylglucosamine hydrolase